jgi:glycosyltransferase involved in cell wall biosynthesis
MACGIPTVATDVGDTSRIVGRAGLLVPPRDAAALAGAIGRLLALDVPARTALSASCRDHIVTNFSMAAATAQYEQLYIDVCGGGVNEVVR